MIRRLTAILASALVLGGCATGGYGYQGGSGDYYHGRASAGYSGGYGYEGYGYDGYGYGYDRYGYGGYGYGPYAPAYYGGHYYGHRPYYPYYPAPRPPVDRPDRPRTVVVPNKRLPGFSYPPGARRYPDKPGGVRGPLTVTTQSDGPPDSSVQRFRRTEVPTRTGPLPDSRARVAPGQSTSGPAPVQSSPPRMRSAPRPMGSEPRPAMRESRGRSEGESRARPSSRARVLDR